MRGCYQSLAGVETAYELLLQCTPNFCVARPPRDAYGRTETVYAIAIDLGTQGAPLNVDAASISVVEELCPGLLLQCTMT